MKAIIRITCYGIPLNLSPLDQALAKEIFEPDDPLTPEEKAMIEHTPGPWKYEQDMRTVFGPNGEWIAEVTDTEEGLEGDCPNADANARLISAAPDLLAACEAVDELWRRSGPNEPCGAVWPIVRAALAKLRTPNPEPPEMP